MALPESSATRPLAAAPSRSGRRCRDRRRQRASVLHHDGHSPSRSPDDREVHARQLQEAKTLLDAEGPTCELLEPDGEVAQTIERVAEDGAYDTVVVGSRGLGAFSSFFGGSVSEHVAAHAGPTVVVGR